MTGEPSLRTLEGNPLLDAVMACGGDPRASRPSRGELTAAYAFGIPDDASLDAIRAAAPSAGIVEIGAGLGYWARLLVDRGVEVVAYDLHPPPSASNQNFAGTLPWHPVLQGDELSVDAHGDRMLLFVWPTHDEDWPAEALTRFYRAGGRSVAYVGGTRGGPTGDDRFHRLLGSRGVCMACTYGATNVPCVCHIHPQWELASQRPVPNWCDREDTLRIFRRLAPEPRTSSRRRRLRGDTWG